MTVDGVSEPHASAILAPIFELLASAILAYIGLRRWARSVLFIHPITSLVLSAGGSVRSAVEVVVDVPFGSHAAEVLTVTPLERCV